MISETSLNQPLAPPFGSTLATSSEGNQTMKKAQLFDGQNASNKDVEKKKDSVIRWVLLDFPLLVILLTFAATSWVRYVHDEYIQHNFKNFMWTNQRRNEEATYYHRDCTPDEISTFRAGDLFLDKDATAEDAYWHQMKHGFTVVRNVLTPPTIKNLRDHIMDFNQKKGKEYDLIEKENRYSFGLSTSEPSVRAMLREFATHKQWKQSVEAVMGPDPAMIEMTAITSAYGARDQHWHDDQGMDTSGALYARSFGPLYSLFIQLQNTTREMGATGICPGTHFCSNGYDWCDEYGYQLVDDDGVLQAGDALIMNMNVLHRGSAHIDPNGEDRVMIILTFGPKPRPIAETRSVAMGSTLSLRWDMWGNTWTDLANAESHLTFPWYLFRAFGIYKPAISSWGYDFFTGLYMRIANDPGYWKGEGLGDFVDGYPNEYIPEFKHNQIPEFLRPDIEELDYDNDQEWAVYIKELLYNVYDFHKKVVACALAIYLISGLILEDIVGAKGRATIFGRMAIFVAISYSLHQLARYRCDNSQWAIDIKSERLFARNMANEKQFGVKSTGFMTLPNKNDMLIENRLSESIYLNNHKDIITLHPGNLFFNGLIKKIAPFAIETDFGTREAAVESVFGQMGLESGRLLEQGVNGNWYVMPKDDALVYISKRIAAERTPVLGALQTIITRMVGELRFGVYRSSALSIKHAFPALKKMEKLLYSNKTVTTSQLIRGSSSLVRPLSVEVLTTKTPDGDEILLSEKSPVTKKAVLPPYVPTKLPSSPSLGEKLTKSLRSEKIKAQPGPEYDRDWIRSGQMVEMVDDTEEYWFLGEVLEVRAHDGVFTVLVDGSEEMVEKDFIRPPVPLSVEEACNFYLDERGETEILESEIIEVNDDGTYTVEVLETEEWHYKVDRVQLTRYVKDGEIGYRQERVY